MGVRVVVVKIKRGERRKGFLNASKEGGGAS